MITLIALLVGALLQTSTARTEYVSFCEIVRHPDQYDQKSVLTTGIYRAGQEFSDFIDPNCSPTAERDIGTFPTPIRERVQDTRSWKRMNQILDKERQVFIVVRGVFDAYNRYEGPLPADPRLQEVLKKGNSRFGHLNFARFRLRIESIEFVAPVNN